MSDPRPVQIDRLMLDLRPLIETVAARHKYWEVRIHGSDGRARIEVIYQGATYSYRPGTTATPAGYFLEE